MRFVMLSEKHLAFVAALFRDLLPDPKLLAQPQGHRHDERSQTARRIVEIGLQQALKFQKRLVIESNQINFIAFDPGVVETELYGVCGKTVVVLLAGEAFFLRGSDNLAVADNTGRRIMIVSRNAEDVRHHIWAERCGTKA